VLQYGDGRLALRPRRPDGTAWRFGSWEEGLPVWKSAPGSSEVRVDPDLESELPDPLEQGIWASSPVAVRKFQARVPLWAWGLRLAFGRYLALGILARHLQARDLLRSHPLLFALIIHKALSSRGDRERFAPWFGLKRREILSRLGLPAEESVVRMLSRLDFGAASRQDLTHLTACLKDPVLLKLLGELGGFPVRLADLLRRHPGFFDTRFFRHELAQALPMTKKRPAPGGAKKPAAGPPTTLEALIARLPGMILFWRDVQKQAERMRRSQPQLRLSEIATWEKVQALSMLWSRVPDLSKAPQLPPRARGVPLSVPFPPPMVRPGKGMRAVTDSEALLAEGEAMRHCVGTYTARILRRQCDIYHVELGGEHATLELRLLRGRALPGELRSFENRPVSAKLRAFVHDWFKEETGLDFIETSNKNQAG
jgi:hypothetical protein